MYWQQPFWDVNLMLKSLKFVVGLIMCMCLLLPGAVNANDLSVERVRNIIAGKQDYLVFAVVDDFDDAGGCTVSIQDEIGVENEDDSKIGQQIDVVGLSSYMFYDSYTLPPRIGDNVLLSLNIGETGNDYRLAWGAFRVNSADVDTFNFVVPDEVAHTEDAMALTALYLYVGSNGTNANYRIDGYTVVTTDSVDASKEIVISEQMGISFVDQSGEIIADNISGQSGNNVFDINIDSSKKWRYAFVIIAAGMILGILAVKITTKIERGRQ